MGVLLLVQGGEGEEDGDGLPKREDVECVCKLFATIGFQLDANLKNKTSMDGYFARMVRWSNLQALESRLRFMLKVRRDPGALESRLRFMLKEGGGGGNVWRLAARLRFMPKEGFWGTKLVSHLLCGW